MAAELVGPGGRVLGFDLQPIRPLAGRNVRTFELDVLAEGAARRMGGLLDGPAECVLSDMAPRLSGIRDADQRRALELARTAYVIAGEILKPGGSLVFKTFTGPEGEELMAEIASRFRTARAVRAAATRKGSSEIYVVVRGFQGRARRAEGASGAGPGEGARG